MCILRVYASVFLFFMFRFFHFFFVLKLARPTFDGKSIIFHDTDISIVWERARARTHSENKMKHESSTACSQTGTRTINGTYHRKKHTKINQTSPKKNNNNRNNTLTILFD